MSSPAWPWDPEWDLWFLGYKEEAIDAYLDLKWRAEMCGWGRGWDKPSRDEVLRLFLQGRVSLRYRGKTPYERFRERNRIRLYDAIIMKYNLGRW